MSKLIFALGIMSMTAIAAEYQNGKSNTVEDGYILLAKMDNKEDKDKKKLKKGKWMSGPNGPGGPWQTGGPGGPSGVRGGNTQGGGMGGGPPR